MQNWTQNQASYWHELKARPWLLLWLVGAAAVAALTGAATFLGTGVSPVKAAAMQAAVMVIGFLLAWPVHTWTEGQGAPASEQVSKRPGLEITAVILIWRLLMAVLVGALGPASQAVREALQSVVHALSAPAAGLAPAGSLLARRAVTMVQNSLFFVAVPWLVSTATAYRTQSLVPSTLLHIWWNAYV